LQGQCPTLRLRPGKKNRWEPLGGSHPGLAPQLRPPLKVLEVCE